MRVKRPQTLLNQTMLKPQCSRRKPPPASKPPTVEIPVDPFEPIVAGRKKEQAEIAKMRMQLEKLVLEMQRKIQASRAKFHAARWKLLNKAMDD